LVASEREDFSMTATSTQAPVERVVDGVPAGPRLPRAVQTAWWGLSPISFVRRCRERHGDVFTLRTLGLGDIVLVGDPAVIKDVFAGDRDVFHAGEANAVMEPVLGAHSLLILDGERHLRERRLMLPPFHGEAVRAYRRRVEEIAEREVATWPLDRAFPVRPRMQAITLEVILRAVIGVSDPARLARLRTLLPKLLEFNVLDMWVVWLFPKVMDTFLAKRHKSMRVRPEVDRLLFEEIAAHRADPDGRDDVLALLVSARDESGGELSDEALRDHLITLLLAGHETTATGLAWAFERLVRHPRALARLREEVDGGEDGYLDAVVSETLRSRPVVDGVWRHLTRPAQVAGHRLPAGTTVMPSIALVQHSRAFDEPDEFRPERFLGEGSAEPYTFIPFGGGPRRCIGASFALMEMKAVLRSVLGRVDVEAAERRPERTRVHHVTLVPARGGRIVARARG
jgi:cytochrome P450